MLDIYRVRINVLMGLGDYRETIDYIAAYCGQAQMDARIDRSLRAQLILACQRSGQPELWQNILPAEDGGGAFAGIGPRNDESEPEGDDDV